AEHVLRAFGIELGARLQRGFHVRCLRADRHALDAMIGEIRERRAPEVRNEAGGRPGLVLREERRLVLRTETHLGGAPRLGPVALSLKGIAREPAEGALGILTGPVERDAGDVQLRDGARERAGFRLLALE